MNSNYYPMVAVCSHSLALSLSRQASNFFKFPRGTLMVQISTDKKCDVRKNICTIFCHMVKSGVTSLHDVVMFLEGANRRENAKRRQHASRNVVRRNAAFAEIAILKDNYTRVRVSLRKARVTIEDLTQDLTIMSDNYTRLHTELEKAKKTIASLSQFREDMRGVGEMVSAMQLSPRVPVCG